MAIIDMAIGTSYNTNCMGLLDIYVKNDQVLYLRDYCKVQSIVEKKVSY